MGRGSHAEAERVTRAEGHKQGVIREAARIAGRGPQAEAGGGHKSRGSQAEVWVTRSEDREQWGHKRGCQGHRQGEITSRGMRVHKSMGHKHGVARGGQKQGCMREGRPRSWQRVPIRGRGVTRAEGDKQRQGGHKSRGSQASGHKRGGQDRRQGVTSRGRGGHKSRRSQARVRKQRSQARVHEREAAKVMAEGYMQRQGGHKSRRLQARGHKKGGS